MKSNVYIFSQVTWVTVKVFGQEMASYNYVSNNNLKLTCILY